MRVRGFRPFRPTEPLIPDDITWQDWITSSGIYDSTSDSFIRDETGDNHNHNNGNSLQPTRTQTENGGGYAIPPLNEVVIEDILAASHAMPSWNS
jgi:hypothetical protein